MMPFLLTCNNIREFINYTYGARMMNKIRIYIYKEVNYGNIASQQLSALASWQGLDIILLVCERQRWLPLNYLQYYYSELIAAAWPFDSFTVVRSAVSALKTQRKRPFLFAWQVMSREAAKDFTWEMLPNRWKPNSPQYEGQDWLSDRVTLLLCFFINSLFWPTQTTMSSKALMYLYMNSTKHQLAGDNSGAFSRWRTRIKEKSAQRLQKV